jgi:ATP synthase protein I
MTRDVETAVARDTVRRAALVGPALVAVFALTRGADGAVASLLGVVIVVGYIVFTGAMLSVAARISLSLYHAAALLGFFLRLGLIAATMLIVARVTDVDRLAMGITVVVAYLVLFGWEAVAMSRTTTERELEWT